MNRPPSVAVVVDLDEETAGMSSPNSNVSSVSGNKRDLAAAARGEGDEAEAERASCSHGGGSCGSDDEDGGNGDGSRKKLRLSKEQALVLEETFKEHSTLNPVSGIFVKITLEGKHLKPASSYFIFEPSDWAEAKAGTSETVESEDKASRSVVPEPQGKVK